MVAAGWSWRRSWVLVPAIFAVLLLQACGPSWAPVEERSGTRQPADSGAYRLTPDGHYRVRRGDTLHAIAFNFGLDWRDLAKWNGIGSPYTIYPDQELRLSPLQPDASPTVVTRPAPGPGRAVSEEQPASHVAESASTPPPVAETSAPATSRPVTATSSERTKPSPQPTPPPEQAPAQTAGPVGDPERWLWPASGRLLSRFQANDPARNGIDIAGDEGEAVRAAAAGEVVYSGNGLIGYGELVIVKHSDRMLSAYAHNRHRLVTEGQHVAGGEPLAEMGRNDRNQVMLHFEIRVNGSPQDPLKYLPRR